MIYIQPIRNFPKVDQWTEGEPFHPWGFACTKDEINNQARGKADQRVGDHQVPSDSLYWPQSRHEPTRKQTGRQDKNCWNPGEQHIKSAKPDDDAENAGFEMWTGRTQIAGCGVLRMWMSTARTTTNTAALADKQVTTRAREDLKRNSNRTGMTR